MKRPQIYAGFIKLEHTVFSLPLIIAGALLHAHLPAGKAGRLPNINLLSVMLLAAIGGRVVAMGLNRIIDAQIDARNPRTQRRELPRGAMAQGEAWAIVAIEI